MNVAIIDYDAGNVQSVYFALERLGIEPVITSNIELIASADKVIFPGVGAAGNAMGYLIANNIDKAIAGLKQPVLGICLGMQLLCRYSQEDNTACIGIFEEEVARFTGPQKVPHMGWNNITALQGPLFKNINESTFVYYVHSFYVPLNDCTIAQTAYGHAFCAAIQKNNFYGVQFHPEKSADAGSAIVRNFIEL